MLEAAQTKGARYVRPQKMIASQTALFELCSTWTENHRTTRPDVLVSEEGRIHWKKMTVTPCSMRLMTNTAHMMMNIDKKLSWKCRTSVTSMKHDLKLESPRHGCSWCITSNITMWPKRGPLCMWPLSCWMFYRQTSPQKRTMTISDFDVCMTSCTFLG